MNCFKIPVSVLVLVHTTDLEFLLLERRAHPGFWQSVTGSQEPGEALEDTARREVAEETAIDCRPFPLAAWNQFNRFEIYKLWRARYAPGVSHNVEQVFALALPNRMTPTLNPLEHQSWRWCAWREAADNVFSWTNRDAILSLVLNRQSTPPRPRP